MIDINSLYQSFTSMANTSQGGFFRPVRDFLPAVHDISMEIFNKLCGKLEKTEQYSDMLMPFFVSRNVVIQKMPTYEYAPYPVDYAFLSSAKILTSGGSICGSSACQTVVASGECLDPDDPTTGIAVAPDYEEREIKIIMDSRFGSASQHVTRKPTAQRPIGTKVAAVGALRGGIKILPRGIGVILLNYYRNPVTPVYNYTTRQNGVDVDIIYNATGSQSLEWDENMRPAFMYKLMARYGLFIDDQLKIQVEYLAKDLL